MIEPIRLYNDVETLKNDITEALKHLEGKTPNLHTMRALIACHDLLPYLSALVALQYGNKKPFEENTDGTMGI